MLSDSEGEKILDDEKLIQTLTISKATSAEIELKMAASKLTEEKIHMNRSNYEAVAKFASNLYFTIFSLRNLDPMYDFSLESFIRTFRKAIKSAEKPIEKKNIKQRLPLLFTT